MGPRGGGEQGLEQTFYCIPFYIFTFELRGCVSYFKNTFWNIPRDPVVGNPPAKGTQM